MPMSPEKVSWYEMKRRKRLERYEGLDVSVCEGLTEFPSFLGILGYKLSPQHSIDRVDNFKGYWCGSCTECIGLNHTINVRWATRKEQCRNTRRNHLLTINSKTKTVAEWTEEAGLPHLRIIDRLRKGWPIDENLLRPVMTSSERLDCALAKARTRKDNRLITHKGTTHCLAEWAELLEIDYKLLHGRLNRGWLFQRAITTPLRNTNQATTQL